MAPRTTTLKKRPTMVDKKQPKKSRVAENIVPVQLFRTRQDILIYRNNLQVAESVVNPNRTELYRGYKDVVLDPHVASVTETRMAMTLSKPFIIMNAEGEPDEDWTAKFNTPNMLRVYRWILESVFYGHSLIELGDIVDDGFINSKLVPRQYVKPENGVWVENPSEMSGTSFREGAWANWLLEAGDPNYDFGLLNNITPYWIIKKNNVNSWATYSERFGEPTIVLKTEVRDEKQRDEATENLLNSGAGSVSVLSEDETLEFIQANTGTGYNTFQDLAKYAEANISKAVLGATMIADDGSSRSQAEVHEKVAEDRMKADIWLLESTANTALIPQMRKLGIPIPEGHNFLVENKEEVSGSELFTRVIELEKAGLRVETDYVNDKFQIPIMERETKEKDPLGK